MKCSQIIDVIEKTYPKEEAESWDNVGLLAGRYDKEVKQIYVGVDLSEAAIDHAIEMGIDMIVTHHPLIYSPIKSVTDGDFIGKRIVKLLQNDISYYAMHTNYDILRMADVAAHRLGIENTEVLEVTNEAGEKGVGKIGTLGISLKSKECAVLVRNLFELRNVRIFGDREKKVNKIAILPGSGEKYIKAALEKGADILITGDIGHHAGIDAAAQGMCIIDAGHYGIEHIFIEDVSAFLEKELEEVKVTGESVVQPFIVI